MNRASTFITAILLPLTTFLLANAATLAYNLHTQNTQCPLRIHEAKNQFEKKDQVNSTNNFLPPDFLIIYSIKYYECQ
jgi:hypothetical protein